MKDQSGTGWWKEKKLKNGMAQNRHWNGPNLRGNSVPKNVQNETLSREKPHICKEIDVLGSYGIIDPAMLLSWNPKGS